jgi:hypothetical protein
MTDKDSDKKMDRYEESDLFVEDMERAEVYVKKMLNRCRDIAREVYSDKGMKAEPKDVVDIYYLMTKRIQAIVAESQLSTYIKAAKQSSPYGLETLLPDDPDSPKN